MRIEIDESGHPAGESRLGGSGGASRQLNRARTGSPANRSLTETGGGILLVSQFTLLGNTKSGRRPGFEDAAPPDEARRWYERVSKELKVEGTQVEMGVFAAHMKVELVNDGPVTFVLDSRNGF